MLQDSPINIAAINHSIDTETIARKAIAKLGSLYSDKAHFVYELVQNAADTSIAKGQDVLGMVLRDEALIAWNKGRPFDTSDIKAICSVGESTKDLTKIGTHGIGFKSVYWYTDAPEIYSGETCFRIRDYMHPEILQRPDETLKQKARQGQTTFFLPFKDRFAVEGKDKIAREMRHLSRWTLLF